MRIPITGRNALDVLAVQLLGLKQTPSRPRLTPGCPQRSAVRPEHADYTRLDGNGDAMLSRLRYEDWPRGTFLFPGSNPRYVIPARYKSKWRATAPPPPQVAGS